MNLLSLLIQQTSSLQTLSFQRQHPAPLESGLLNALAIGSAFGSRFLGLRRLSLALRLRFPATHPTPHELGAVRLPHEFPVQKEVDDG
jgi:hypothetical protein